MNYKAAIIGLGFVGLSLASFLASKNVIVTGIDNNKEKLDQIRNGKPPFYEPNLQSYLKKALKGRLTLESEVSKKTLMNDFIFITVGTTTNSHGRNDLSHVKSVCIDLAKNMLNLKNVPAIIIKSTVVPGTTNQIIKRILEKNGTDSKDFHLLSNPEFLKEGSAMGDTISPHVIVVGGSNKKGRSKLIRFYKKIYPKKQQFLETNNNTAELIKYANNSFLATKISFINSIANICQKITGTNIDDIAKAIGMDPRISNLFLKAGPGYGGSCFPKDLKAFINFSNEIGYKPILLNAVQETNSLQVKKIIEIIKQNIHSLNGQKIGILGLAFKENTDDIRESVSIYLIKELLKYNCKLEVHDPRAMENSKKIFRNQINYCKNQTEVFSDTSCVILLTPWNEYRKLNKKSIFKMKKLFIIDTRRILKLNDPRIKVVQFGVGD